ncbi:hypothetical protein NDU88_003188 [Pleurodeles waltl]|uniref:Uncharacterized protein n=1 Tax=Pleurodeles waltl TaxID=8319 RepID=A0AAV7V1P5_PLEWA|nr:hypothetical protein NDU88_003188 [Pleurodeles waltl]
MAPGPCPEGRDPHCSELHGEIKDARIWLTSFNHHSVSQDFELRTHQGPGSEGTKRSLLGPPLSTWIEAAASMPEAPRGWSHKHHACLPLPRGFLSLSRLNPSTRSSSPAALRASYVREWA